MVGFFEIGVDDLEGVLIGTFHLGLCIVESLPNHLILIGPASTQALFKLLHGWRGDKDVDEAKPDPALYHLGLERMGSSPGKVVVLEDSPNGVLAAKRAGLYCIAVPNQITSQLPFFTNGGAPDRILESLLDFPWDEFMMEDR